MSVNKPIEKQCQLIGHAENRVHVKIEDAAQIAYQVPESVFPRPKRKPVSRKKANLQFDITEEPFSFRIFRKDGNETIFDSSAAGLVFEDQYLRLRTSLPTDTNLYGLGEHTDDFRLKTDDYHRTIFNADAPGLPQGQNLYGSHPIYIEHRPTGSHGVFLLNSGGMDVFIDKDDAAKQYLEYNVLGGVLDFYFLAGPSPIDVSRQYSDVTGRAVTIPYASLGFHNCRWGYQDAYNLAEVISNYSAAGIPLETMWADIDYMDGRKIFSVDPDRFPLKMMREIADHLHANNQHFTLMVDPATAAADYPPYHRGLDDDAFIRRNGETFHAVVWPGVTAFPDWFAPNATKFWNNEFATFFSKENGVDIDFLWIDMNEPANFCAFPCDDPVSAAEGLPPVPPPTRTPPRPLPGWSCDFQPPGTDCKRSTVELRSPAPAPEAKEIENIHARNADDTRWKGYPGRDLLNPPYAIKNVQGILSAKTIRTDLIHHNGLTQLDTHNLYGTMMSSFSREAMLARRPGKRPLVITRATFAGAGSHVSHWLGDNNSDWPHYLWSIRGMLAFASVFQVPMVGSDVCGFGSDTTEELCARWAMLGAFQPFYRNHNAEGQISQEFYRWESVTKAAKKAIDIRYRLLDYFYTAMMRQSTDGTPAINPMFYLYPNDPKTYGLDYQYFFGPAILVAPVTAEGATSVDVYLPAGTFYDYHTKARIVSKGQTITMKDQTTSDIPLFIRGGTVVPQRVKSAMTTTDLAKENFEIVIAPDENNKASGSLYLDDGESLDGESTVYNFEYDGNKLTATGKFGYKTNSKIVQVILLGGGQRAAKSATTVQQELNGPFTINL